MRNPPLLAAVALAAALVATTRPALACDPASFDTPYDLIDQATTAAVVTITAVTTGRVEARREETLKGQPAATIAIVDPPGGSCAPGFAVGARGVIYLDATGHALGLYAAFERDAGTIDALRGYATGSTAAARATALGTAAIDKDWSRSFRAAYALADRPDLIVALGTADRDAVVARLRKAGVQHPLVRVAARLADPRVAAITRKRGFDDADALRAVLAGGFEAETDTGALADVIGATKARTRDRIAALERCERVWGHALARLSTYAYEPAEPGEWQARGDACRSGTPVP